jgi:hypothetical protein
LPIRVALDVAIDALPEMNATLMIVNTDGYGGSGGEAVAVFSAGAMETALHEMGHSHFHLADEYDYPGDEYERFPGTEPAEANVTANVHRLKWSALVTPGTTLPTMNNADCSRVDENPSSVADGVVGAFEGARYFRCGIYRPEYGCRMRTTNQPFCAVCRNEIMRVLLPHRPRRRSVRH